MDTPAPSASRPDPRPALHPLGRWIGWRLRLLIAVALATCLGIFSLTRWLAQTPYLPLQFHADATGIGVAALGGQVASLPPGARLDALIDPEGRRLPGDPRVLQLAPRWQVHDDARARHLDWQHQIARAAGRKPLTLRLADGQAISVALAARGYNGLGLAWWPLVASAMLLMLVGAVVALSRPQPVNLLFMVMTSCQAVQVMWVAVGTLPGAGLPPALVDADMPVRMALDLLTAAAGLGALTLHPRRHPAWRSIAGLAWAGTAAVFAGVSAGVLVPAWSWLQATLLACTAAGLWLTLSARRRGPDPVAALTGRFVGCALALGSLISLALIAATAGQAPPPAWSPALPIAWHLALAGLLMAAPFVTRSRRVMREFALLAGISAVASALDLLFVAVFSLSPFTSLALVVFLVLGVYASLRQWVFGRFGGGQPLSTERLFEQLYRAAREVQAQPSHYATALAGLLQQLFEPLDVTGSERAPARSSVARGGAALRVPVRPPAGPDIAAPASLVLRYAGRGRRLFTAEDAQLADRVASQLRQAVAYDAAVERGRSEERLRIAQDLHDDIGARLLTLMYQAPNREMEDYLRHTLKDLKTLTRGLAASEHRLSHAMAEWKTDLAQRMDAARIDLDWNASVEADGLLSMVQWSALTRVLRELATNAIHHAKATRVSVLLQLDAQGLRLRVADNGIGGDPQAWAPGLGLGGVRKRVKLLGGEVAWQLNVPQGIVCEVRVRDFVLRA